MSLNYYELEKNAKENLLAIENEKNEDNYEELFYRPNTHSTNFRGNIFKNANKKCVFTNEKADSLPTQWQTISSYNPFLFENEKTPKNIKKKERKPFENNISTTKIPFLLRKFQKKEPKNAENKNENNKTHRKAMSSINLHNQKDNYSSKNINFFQKKKTR